jgi:putative transposon-encoded protein
MVAHRTDTEVSSPEDLIGKKVCGISPPNLSTLSVLARMNNPARQPVILGIKGGMNVVLKRFNHEDCRAAVFRNAFYKKKISISDRNNMKILFSSEALPNQVITVSNKISKTQINKLTNSILFGKAEVAANRIVKRFGGKAKSFVVAKKEEYLDARELLEGVIFGW